MLEDRFLKRLRKKARRGLLGVANCDDCVGIVPSENAEAEALRDWKVNRGDIRADPGVAQEIPEFIERHQVLTVAMTDQIIVKANGTRFARFGAEEIALRDRGSIDFCETSTSERGNW